jgi:hypothetical protein
MWPIPACHAEEGQAMNPDDLTPKRDWNAELEIAEFLVGVPKNPAAIMAAFDELATAQEAELAAHGIRPVTVVHGDVQDDEDAALILGTDPGRPSLHDLAGEAGQYHRTVGGNAGNFGYRNMRNGCRSCAQILELDGQGKVHLPQMAQLGNDPHVLIGSYPPGDGGASLRIQPVKGRQPHAYSSRAPSRPAGQRLGGCCSLPCGPSRAHPHRTGPADFAAGQGGVALLPSGRRRCSGLVTGRDPGDASDRSMPGQTCSGARLYS